MRREYRIQSLLKPAFPYVPEMVAFCDDESVLGADFYVMERLHGIILRGRLPQGMSLPPDAGPRAVPRDGRPAGRAARGRRRRRRPGRVRPRHRLRRPPGRRAGRSATARRRRWNVPSFEKVMRWLEENQPADVGTCLIHNDWRFDNLVLDADDPAGSAACSTGRWPRSAIPLMDLGSALAYWVQADDDRLMGLLQRQPTHLPGMLTRAEMVEAYCDRSGRTGRRLDVLRGLRPVPARGDRAADLLPLRPQADPQPGVPALLDRRELPRPALPAAHPIGDRLTSRLRRGSAPGCRAAGS